MPAPTPRRSITAAAAAWGAVVAGGAIVISQLRRWDGPRPIAIAQTLTPYVVPVLAPIALCGVRRNRWALAVSAAAAGAGGLALVAPTLCPSAGPTPAPGTRGVRVATVNLLYTNGRTEAIAAELSRRDVDVIVFTECTEIHLGALLRHELASDLPHRVNRPGPRARGVAVWSRLEMLEHRPPATINHSVDVTVTGPDGPFRLVGMHAPTPVYDLEEWLADLEAIRAAGASGTEPTLLIGDFNATCWHPALRRILESGFTDAHVAAGRGLAVSWPAGGMVPPFAQLDHALTARGLVATEVENFDVPGSDHRAVAVTVRPARRATP